MTTPATTPLVYNSYIQQIATMAVVNTTTVDGVVVGVDDAFNAIIPQMLSYSELRIQRDTDLLPSLTSNSYNFIANQNTLSISVNDFVTVQTFGYVNGTVTTQLLPVSKEFIMSVYGDTSYTAPPQYFAMVGGDQATGGNTSNNIMVGPTPDQSYSVSVYGTQRLPTLYQFATPDNASTRTTFISTYLPDLLVQASMVYIAEFQRNFLATSNSPDMPGAYETQYQTLLGRVIVEEQRKRFAASAWSSMSPPSVASPTR